MQVPGGIPLPPQQSMGYGNQSRDGQSGQPVMFSSPSSSSQYGQQHQYNSSPGMQVAPALQSSSLPVGMNQQGVFYPPINPQPWSQGLNHSTATPGPQQQQQQQGSIVSGANPYYPNPSMPTGAVPMPIPLQSPPQGGMSMGSPIIEGVGMTGAYGSDGPPGPPSLHLPGNPSGAVNMPLATGSDQALGQHPPFYGGANNGSYGDLQGCGRSPWVDQSNGQPNTFYPSDYSNNPASNSHSPPSNDKYYNSNSS